MEYSPRYLPRKGTETVFDRAVEIGLDGFATIFTPQGDGNSTALLTYTPKGKDSPRYLPRKGTETYQSSP